jgi:hypothetical protein
MNNYTKNGWRDQAVDPNPEYIVCAAMLMHDDAVITGVRHFSPDMRATIQRIYGNKGHLKVVEQGFITQYGRFVDRKEAADIVRETKQHIRADHYPKTLFSEDLY